MARISKAFFRALCSFGALDQFAKCQGPSSKVPLPGPNYSVRMCQANIFAMYIKGTPAILAWSLRRFTYSKWFLRFVCVLDATCRHMFILRLLQSLKGISDSPWTQFCATIKRVRGLGRPFSFLAGWQGACTDITIAGVQVISTPALNHSEISESLSFHPCSSIYSERFTAVPSDSFLRFSISLSIATPSSNSTASGQNDVG